MSSLVIRSARPDDWPALSEMGARTFTGSTEETYRIGLASWLDIPHSPGFDWDAVRVGEVDGEVVAHVAVMDRVLEFEGVRLPFGGVAGVMTHPDHRKRGYAAVMLRDAIQRMSERGYHLSLLDGIANFYGQFGYANVWPVYTVTFTPEQGATVADAAEGCRVRPGTPDDVPAVYALWDAAWRDRPWRAVRSQEAMRYRLLLPVTTGAVPCEVVEDADGALRGYVAGGSREQRGEIVTTDCASTAALMHHTAQQFAEEPERRLAWLVTPDERAGREARRLCRVGYHRWAGPEGGWMARFIETHAALDALRPAIAARLRALDLPSADDLTLRAAGNDVTLDFGATCVSVPRGRFLQLLFGYLAPEDVDDLLPALDDPARALLKRIFPPAANQFPGLDWF